MIVATWEESSFQGARRRYQCYLVDSQRCRCHGQVKTLVALTPRRYYKASGRALYAFGSG